MVSTPPCKIYYVCKSMFQPIQPAYKISYLWPWPSHATTIFQVPFVGYYGCWWCMWYQVRYSISILLSHHPWYYNPPTSFYLDPPFHYKFLWYYFNTRTLNSTSQTHTFSWWVAYSINIALPNAKIFSISSPSPVLTTCKHYCDSAIDPPPSIWPISTSSASNKFTSDAALCVH